MKTQLIIVMVCVLFCQSVMAEIQYRMEVTLMVTVLKSEESTSVLSGLSPIQPIETYDTDCIHSNPAYQMVFPGTSKQEENVQEIAYDTLKSMEYTHIIVWPQFDKNYEEYCEALRNGAFVIWFHILHIHEEK